MRFRDREHAAELLGDRLHGTYKNTYPLVLGIPRGAVPMARIIADRLGGELDVVLVHKLSHPEEPELAIGVIDEDGHASVSAEATDSYPAYIEEEKNRQLDVLKRRRMLYTPGRGPIDPRGRVVIVVDDGSATGATMIAALRAVRGKNPKKLVAAVAVASPEAAKAIRQECDALYCLNSPSRFYGVGQVFDDFAPVLDVDVVRALTEKTHPEATMI